MAAHIKLTDEQKSLLHKLYFEGMPVSAIRAHFLDKYQIKLSRAVVYSYISQIREQQLEDLGEIMRTAVTNKHHQYEYWLERAEKLCNSEAVKTNPSLQIDCIKLIESILWKQLTLNGSTKGETTDTKQTFLDELQKLAQKTVSDPQKKE
jgi:hypothetical protein